jgi:hypothetical protein
MNTTKSTSRYDGRTAAAERRVIKLTLYASVLALVLRAWKYVKTRPAKTLCLWIFGGVLGLADLILRILLPGVDLHLEPAAIIEFVAKIAEWLAHKFETLHILQLLFWMALALATGHDKPPGPPLVEVDIESKHKAPRRRQRRRRKKPV